MIWGNMCVSVCVRYRTQKFGITQKRSKLSCKTHTFFHQIRLKMNENKVKTNEEIMISASLCVQINAACFVRDLLQTVCVCVFSLCVCVCVFLYVCVCVCVYLQQYVSHPESPI